MGLDVVSGVPGLAERAAGRRYLAGDGGRDAPEGRAPLFEQRQAGEQGGQVSVVAGKGNGRLADGGFRLGQCLLRARVGDGLDLFHLPVVADDVEAASGIAAPLTTTRPSRCSAPHTTFTVETYQVPRSRSGVALPAASARR